MVNFTSYLHLTLDSYLHNILEPFTQVDAHIITSLLGRQPLQYASRQLQSILEKRFEGDDHQFQALTLLLGCYSIIQLCHLGGYFILEHSDRYQKLATPSVLRPQLVDYLSAFGIAGASQTGADLIDNFIQHENTRVQQYYTGCFDVFLGSGGVMAGLVLSLNFVESSQPGDTKTIEFSESQVVKGMLGVAFTLLTATLSLSAYGKVQMSKTRVDWWFWRDRLNIMAWTVAVWNMIGLFLLALALEIKMEHRAFATVPLLITGAVLTLRHLFIRDGPGPDGDLATRYLRKKLGKTSRDQWGGLVSDDDLGTM